MSKKKTSTQKLYESKDLLKVEKMTGKISKRWGHRHGSYSRTHKAMR